MNREEKPEERKHERAPVACRVRLVVKDQDEFSAKFAHNISEGGIFVASSSEVAVGTKVEVEISLKTGARLVRATGEVVRVQKPDPASGRKVGGLAIKFVDIDEESRARIKELVNKNKDAALIDTSGTGKDKEARTFKRTRAARKIRFVSEEYSELKDAVARNISEGGMFVHTSKPPKVGSAVEVEFALKGGEKILTVLARTAWVRTQQEAEDKGEPPGCGLEFIKLSPGTRDDIKALVEKFEQDRAAAAGSTGPGQEKRKFARIPLKRKIRIVAKSFQEALEAMSRNISEGGLFVVSEKMPEMGDKVDVEFSLKSGEKILCAKSEVVWLRKPGDAKPPEQPAGFGLKFIELNPGDREEIKKLVQKFEEDKGGQEAGEKGDVKVEDETVEDEKAREPGPLDTADRKEAAASSGEGEVAKEPETKDEPASAEEQEPPVAAGDRERGAAEPAAAVEEASDEKDREKVLGIDLSGDVFRISAVLDESIHVVKPVPSRDDVVGIERLLGRKCKARMSVEIAGSMGMEILPDARREVAVVLDGREVPVEELVVKKLSKSVSMAKAKFKTRAEACVAAVPGHFDPVQRQAVKSACKRAGIEKSRLVNRTTAAAVAYCFNRNADDVLLVYDLGSSGFEAAVVKVVGNTVEVLSRTGEPGTGSSELAGPLYELLKEHLAASAGSALPEPLETELELALRREAEAALSGLADADSVQVKQERFAKIGGKDLNLDVSVEREKVTEGLSGIVAGTVELTREAVEGAGEVKPGKLLLVGEHSRLPEVVEALKQAFGLEPEESIDNARACSIGAGLLADSESRVDLVSVRDIASQTVGIGLPGGGFQPLIEKGTKLPASAKRMVGSAKSDRTIIEVHLFHAGNHEGAYHDYLTSYVLPSVHSKEGPIYDLTVSLDEEGKLGVEARDLDTREMISLGPAAPADPDEVAVKLGARGK